MTLDQFDILLDNPSKSYFPGDVVSGTVLIKSSRKKKTQGIKLRFEGNASVQWTEDPMDIRGASGGIKNFSATENYFEFQSYLLGDGGSDMYIESGESSYPFSFQLPTENLPSSFTSTHGRVEYFLEASVKRSWKFDYHARKVITVNSIVNLNNHSVRPGKWEVSKQLGSTCCTASDSLNVRICSNKVCYYPGEVMALEVAVENMTTDNVADLSVELLQDAKYFAQSHWTGNRSILHSLRRGKPVAAGESEAWRVSIEIPALPPSKLGGCAVIDVEYMISVTVYIAGLTRDINQLCPIIIGSAPPGSHQV